MNSTAYLSKDKSPATSHLRVVLSNEGLQRVSGVLCAEMYTEAVVDVSSNPIFRVVCKTAREC